MILRALFILSLITSALFANKVIYFNYDQVPQRVIKGQIFEVRVKTLSTVKDFSNITYQFTNHPGIRVLNTVPYREKKGKFYYDTFKLYLTASRAKLPDIEASLIAGVPYDSTTIVGENLNIITLNPQKDFSNIIADSFTLTNYKTTSYDNKHNIVLFSGVATNSMLNTIHFNNVYKQGTESIEQAIKNANVTYFVVIDKKYETFSFSYFNLLENKFIDIKIPIIVDDDSVTTQTDLKPTNQSHEKIKTYIAAAVSLLLILFALWRRKYIYLVLLVFPIAYLYLTAAPDTEVCIKQDAAIHLLPVDNGTIFERTQSQIYLPKEGSVKRYVKVRLENEKIGWVKNEDTCAN
ncbi:hypothetical protein [Sulfurimonas sp. C5]|uniref:hypothetical protein n=1 Tax=Sulfurimonas sp. C5 TaxID=3036947 RepID=UPI0024586B3E|nr:hypothetical protein [Sulfurimonas sp. C5]MDH4945127.1 hypothetical protein [Sulfurimonas sp. C5]